MIHHSIALNYSIYSIQMSCVTVALSSGRVDATSLIALSLLP